MAKSRPPYSLEYRLRIIELVRAGRGPAQLEKEFGPSARTIRSWVAQAERAKRTGVDSTSNNIPDMKPASAPESENGDLSRRRAFPDGVVRPVVFETPDRLTNIDSWHGHIPFAFWIVETLQPDLLVELGTHKGDSYCAFDQVVDRLGLRTACYAIDTWRGDDHAGFYGEEVFEELRRYHDPRYGRFSRLIRSTFDDAAGYFSEDSIDLLHLDGLHTYNAVRHDFETWRPKLSSRSVVLFHDINVLESDFGVRRLWDELAREYPSFSFRHSHGLGVLAVGSNMAEPIRRLVTYDHFDSERVRVFFSKLGGAVCVSSEAANIRTSIAALRSELSESERQHALLGETLRQIKSERDIAHSERTVVESLLKEEELKNADLAGALQQAESKRYDISSHLKEAESRLRDGEQTNAELAQALRQTEQQRDDVYDQLNKAESRLSDGERKGAELAEAFRRTESARDEAYGWLTAAECRLNEREEENAELTNRACRADNDLQEARARLQRVITKLKAQRAKSRILETAKDSLMADNDSIRSEHLTLKRKERSIAEASQILLSEVNNLWTSRSWRFLRPVRNLINQRHGLGKETEREPTLHSEWSELRTIETIISIRQSLSWELTMPLRLIHRIFVSHSRPVDTRGGRFAPYVRNETAGTDFPHSQPATGRSLGESRNASITGNDEAKLSMRHFFATRLAAFLATDNGLKLPRHSRPEVSIILVLYNQAPLTFGCISSISECLGTSAVGVEVIIVDNNSIDETADLLQHIQGATVLHNDANLGFLKAVNQAALHAQGRFILLLNNDAQLLPGSLEAAVHVLNSSSDVGAVGARLILPDGSLQEAGSIVWNDGSCLGYGRGESPTAPPYMFRRNVDYCSGAFLLTRSELFSRFGGFDEAFVPAYYEETDYCMRLWEAGYRVVYEPETVVLHYEFGSAEKVARAMDLQEAHRAVLVERHSESLRSRLAPSHSNVLYARSPGDRSQRLLMIEDRIPRTSLGAGFPRSGRILRELAAAGLLVTFFPATSQIEEWRDVRATVPPEVEVMLGFGIDKIKNFLEERSGFYGAILVCRPHNMRTFLEVARRRPELTEGTTLIYDAEAIFAARDILEMRLRGNPPEKAMVEEMLAEEASLAQAASLVLSVSTREASEFRRLGVDNVEVLGHILEPTPGLERFETRRGLLFVGRLEDEGSPNVDGLGWFVQDILPLVRKTLEQDVSLIAAGADGAPSVSRLKRRGTTFLGTVEDLSPVYNASRVFIAPTRFAAGIPLKVYEAAAHGVPSVVTPLLAEQLGWCNEEDLLVGGDAQEFAAQCVRLYRDEALWTRLRKNALNRIREDCSPVRFRQTISRIVDATRTIALPSHVSAVN
jgi:O-antigen biosynthesis protein